MTIDWTTTEVRVVEEIDSTNAEARRVAEAGASGPLWIVARRQSAGRGRLDRTWQTPNGNLAATLLIPVSGWPPDRASDMGFAATLSVVDLLRTPLFRLEPVIKWPNDVLVSGKKLSGILLESFVTGRGISTVAVGIGLNIASCPDPAEVRWPASCLAVETGTCPEVLEVFERLAPCLQNRVDQIACGERQALMADWRDHLKGVGEAIEVHTGKQVLCGTFSGVDDMGHLCLATVEGERKISAAEIFFAGQS